MICKLDFKKANELRAIINADDYCYFYDKDQYFELCTIMDRLEDTVKIINNFNLPYSENQSYATDFICWLNYAYLIYNCIEALNRLFILPNNQTLFASKNKSACFDLDKKKTIYLGKYYQCVSGCDDEFFKYLRSMVLAHALKINFKEFEKYSGSTFTYTPLVNWNNDKSSIEILYYAPNQNDQNRILEIKIEDLFKFLQSRYDYLDIIFKYIIIAKNNERHKKQLAYQDAFETLPTNIMEKLALVQNKFYELGNIDVQNKANILYDKFVLTGTLLNFESKENSEKITIFKSILNEIIDIEILSLKKQNEDISIIIDFYAYMQNKNGNFSTYSYELNKIITDYKSLLCFGNYDFNCAFKKIQHKVEKYLIIPNNASIQDKVNLCIIANCIDNVLYNKKITQSLSNKLVEDLRKIYEISI